MTSSASTSEEDLLYHDATTVHKIKAALQEGLLPFAVERAAGAPDAKLYYGALSVAVETIALLLFVEAFRRKLDHWAIHRPIFTAVLDGVYRELATLGIVELFIHLLHEYYDDLDVAKEAVFVDVHFVFFYTAIFNALQSAIMAFFAHRVSYNTWVRTEELELNHYVEIREEFDRVRVKLYGNNPFNDGYNTSTGIVNSIKSFQDTLQKQSIDRNNNTMDSTNDDYSCWASLKRFCLGVFYTFKYPRLKAKHDALLIQVRFHELRVHFLQAYDLPNKLKVSTYLMRSLQAVLKHLIHISTMAWLWLTGMINVLYFITGIVADVTETAASSGTTLAICFVLEMAAFLFVSLVVYRRMNVIFMQIMEMKHLWDLNGGGGGESLHPPSETNGAGPVDYEDGPLHKSSRFRDKKLASEQLKLFWLQDPKMVIIAIQFMQFGYAIAIAVVVVYWENMNAGGTFAAEFYLFMTLGCYAIFVVIMSQTLVRFTMATSLGQLVDRKRLHETVALFRLEEAERRRQQRMEMNMDFYFDKSAPVPSQRLDGGDLVQPTKPTKPEESQALVAPAASQAMTAKTVSTRSSEIKMNGGSSTMSPFQEVGESDVVVSTAPLTEELLLHMPGSDNQPQPPIPKQIPIGGPPKSGLAAIPEKKATIEPEKATMLMDLVKMDTGSLRAAVPLEEIRKAERRDRRRNRRKSVSDGVALMSAIGKVGQNVMNVLDAVAPPPVDPFIGKFKRTATDENVNRPSSAAGPTPSPKFTVDDSVLVKQRRERRQNRKKAVSASAAIQQMREFTADQKTPEGGRSSFDTWNSPIKPIPKPAPQQNAANSMAPVSTPIMFASPSTMFASPSKPQVTVDDSSPALMATRQRRQRRGSRQKALSASAAVKLMQDASGNDGEEIQREQQSMMEFWGASKGVAGADNGIPPPNACASLESLEQSELRLQNQSFLSAIQNESHATGTSTMLMPVREVSATLEDDSSRVASWSRDSPEQKEPPALNMLSRLSLSQSASDEVATPKRVTLMLPFREGEVLDAPSPDKPGWLDDDSEGTVETDRSVGGLSHVGDVTDFRRNHSFAEEDEAETGLSCAARLANLNERARNYFLSPSYGFITHLMGTMMCFFLIGMRVEGFLKQQCIVPIDDATWELALEAAFWLIVACMSSFILGAMWKVVIFPACLEDQQQADQGGPRGKKRERWVMFVASIIDLIICICCFMIFLGAEIERCCDGNEYPSEAYLYDVDGHSDPYGYTDDHLRDDDYGKVAAGDHEPASDGLYRLLAAAYEEKEAEVCDDSTTYCNCPRFGTRLEGGLGAIEPFSALIMLRMFRFILATFIINRFDLCNESEEAKHDADGEGGKSQSHAHLTSHGGHGAGTGSSQNGTIVEHWQEAVSQFPDIVEKHGEFSAELLQAMLGVEITGSLTRPQSGPAAENPTSPATSEGASSGRMLRRSTSSYEQLQGNEPIVLEEKKYCKLAPEVQEIIVAGKLGCPVKSCHNLEGLMSREPSSPNLLDLANPDGPVEFEVDVAQMEIDRLESTSAFKFPNARLVRSMRRCEKKLLPLLTHWKQVDVVLTNHEIVYVHVDDGEGSDDGKQLREAGRQALAATKGGKNLRLCDVSAGRRVIGHMSFSDIVSVYVERVPRLPESVPRSAQETTAELNHGHVEYWQDKPEDDRGESLVDRQKRWDSIHQDSLRIETISGVLYLRFCFDLEDTEAHPERVIAESDETNPIYKDTALQWAQTIIRQCKVGQLKQPLPHFGANDQSELRDFLQIVPREEKTRGHRRFASASVRNPTKPNRHARSPSRGRRSVSELPTLPGYDVAVAALSRRNVHDAGHPLTSSATSSPPKMPRPRKFTRFASYDENLVNASTKSKKEEDDDGRALSIA